MRREDCTKRRVVGGPSNMIRFSEVVYIFYFLLPFYLRILFLYTTDFNPRINKDIIIYNITHDISDLVFKSVCLFKVSNYNEV